MRQIAVEDITAYSPLINEAQPTCSNGFYSIWKSTVVVQKQNYMTKEKDFHKY